MKFKTVFAMSALALALTSSKAAMHPGGGTWTNVTVVGETACTAARCPPHGWVTFKLSADATGNPPDCSRENRNQIAIDVSEGTGGGWAAHMLNLGMVSGMSFTVNGTGMCSVDAVIETAGTVTYISGPPGATIARGPPIHQQ